MQTVGFALLKSKLLILTIIAVVGMAATALVILEPNLYESQATLLVRESARESVTPESAITMRDSEGGSRLGAVGEEIELLTDPVVYDRIVTRIGADRILQPFDPAAVDGDSTPLPQRLLHQAQSLWFGSASGAAPAPGELERVARDIVRGGLRFSTRPLSNLIHVSYAAHMPELARDIVAAAIEVAKERHQEVYALKIPYELLDAELKDAQASWREAIEALNAFRADHELADIDIARTRLVQELSDLRSEVAADEIQIGDMQARLHYLSEEIDGETPTRELQSTVAETPNPMYMSLMERLFDLKGRRIQVDVEADGTAQQIADLRKQIDGLISETEEVLRQVDPYIAPGGSTSVVENARYTRLQSRVDDISEQVRGVTVALRMRRERLVAIWGDLRALDAFSARHEQLGLVVEQSRARVEALSGQRQQMEALKKLDDLEISNLLVTQPATLPLDKVGPARVRRVMLAVAFGLAVGCALAVLRFRLSGRLHRRADVLQMELVRQVAAVAETAKLRRIRPGQLVSALASVPRSLGTLWVDLAALRQGGGLLRIGVIAEAEGSGASTIAGTLAVGLARGLGDRVLLADVRAPSSATTLVAPAGAERATWPVTAATSVPALRTTSVAANDDRVVPEMLDLVQRVSEQDAGFFVVDLPDFRNRPDVGLVARALDVVVVVVRAHLAHQEDVRGALERLVESGREIVVVLNRYRSPFPRWVRDADRS